MTSNLNFDDKIGILDPEGINLNPLNNEPYSDKYRSLGKIWSKYPAYERVEDILDLIDKNQLIFLSSGTGSGKSVLIPKIALHYTGYNGTVLMTLPKRLITVSTATFAATTLDIELGKEIGYVFKNSPKEMSNPTNKIVYVTDGILIMQFINDPTLSKFNVIIIDEAHERKVQIDLIMLFIKNLLLSGKRPDLKVIFMSATIDTGKYQKYFAGIQSAIIEIAGQPNYPIDIHYLDQPSKSYLLDGLDRIKEIEQMSEPPDTLFFITTSNEALQLCKKVRPLYPKAFCIEVFADMDRDLKIYAESRYKYNELGDYHSKLIMATNVAESSLTIEGLKIVIDSGFELESRFDPQHVGRILEKKFITKSQAIQRRGRVGRTESGTCYHLLTKEQFESLAEYPSPSILKEDITMELLKIMQITENSTFAEGTRMMSELMDPPKKPYMDYAHSLYELYNIIDSTGKMNKIAYNITSFSAQPLNRILFLIYAFQLHCAKEASIIMAMLDVSHGKFDNLFFKIDTLCQSSYANPNSKKLVSNLITKTSDHLTFLNIFSAFKKQSDSKAWANEYGIKLDLLKKADSESKKFYYKMVNFSKTSNVPQLDRVSSLDLKKRLIKALQLSHQHLVAKKLVPVFPAKKSEGKISRDSVVFHHVDKKKLNSAKFIFDEMIQIDGNWQYNIITII